MSQRKNRSKNSVAAGLSADHHNRSEQLVDVEDVAERAMTKMGFAQKMPARPANGGDWLILICDLHRNVDRK